MGSDADQAAFAGLQVITGVGPLPTARILNGSVIHRVVWGFTKAHALGRAAHAAQSLTDGPVRVARRMNRAGISRLQPVGDVNT